MLFHAAIFVRSQTLNEPIMRSRREIRRRRQDETTKKKDVIIDENLTPLQREILKTKHPFERNGMTNGKTLSALQKALTYCIKQEGGWATESHLVDFMLKNWKEITQISHQKFQQEPGLRLLHINTAIRKNGEYLFLRRSPNLVGINMIGSDDVTNDSDHADEEEEQIKEDEPILTHEPVHKLTFDDHVPFEERVFEIVRASRDGIPFDELVEYARDFANVSGWFAHLDVHMRVRACLLTYKVERHLSESPDHIWRTRISTSRVPVVACKRTEYEYLELDGLPVCQLYQLLHGNPA